VWRIGLVILVAGCNLAGNEALVEEARVLESRACSCKDAACVDAVVVDVGRWFDKNKNAWGTDRQLERVEVHFGRMGTCMGTIGMSDASMKTLERIAAEAEKL
jgi:hypothetical protein